MLFLMCVALISLARAVLNDRSWKSIGQKYEVMSMELKVMK